MMIDTQQTAALENIFRVLAAKRRERADLGESPAANCSCTLGELADMAIAHLMLAQDRLPEARQWWPWGEQYLPLPAEDQSRTAQVLETMVCCLMELERVGLPSVAGPPPYASTDREQTRLIAKEIDAVNQGRFTPLEVGFDPYQGFVLVSMLRFAMRHPAVGPNARESMDALCLDVEARIAAQMPAMGQVLADARKEDAARGR